MKSCITYGEYKANKLQGMHDTLGELLKLLCTSQAAKNTNTHEVLRTTVHLGTVKEILNTKDV